MPRMLRKGMCRRAEAGVVEAGQSQALRRRMVRRAFLPVRAPPAAASHQVRHALRQAKTGAAHNPAARLLSPRFPPLSRARRRWPRTPQSRPRPGSRQRCSGRHRRAARMAWAMAAAGLPRCQARPFAPCGQPEIRTDLARQPQIPPPPAEPSCPPAPSYRQGSSPGRARIGRSPSLVGAQRR